MAYNLASLRMNVLAFRHISFRLGTAIIKTIISATANPTWTKTKRDLSKYKTYTRRRQSRGNGRIAFIRLRQIIQTAGVSRRTTRGVLVGWLRFDYDDTPDEKNNEAHFPPGGLPFENFFLAFFFTPNPIAPLSRLGQGPEEEGPVLVVVGNGESFRFSRLDNENA